MVRFSRHAALSFHPLIAEWFYRQVGQPIDVQAQGLGSFIVFRDGVVVRSVIGL